jgi:KaiC/GvpD/RAD55 family RecA-like ATPase
VTLVCQFEKEGRGEDITYPLPWQYLDYLTNCLAPGTVTIVAGPTCVGKSYFMMDIALSLHRRGTTWAYMPLEDKKCDWERRALCMIDGTFNHNKKDKEFAQRRIDAHKKHEDELKQIMYHVAENPRQRHDQPFAIVDHELVENWVEARAQDCAVVVVDPYAQIEIDGPKPWEMENKFIRRMCNIATKGNAAVIIVMHTKSRPGRAASAPLTVEDIQGSTNFGRLFHSILLLNQYGDDRKGNVLTYDNQTVYSIYNTTIHIAKARNGCGTRKTMAFNFKHSPVFEEIGIVCPPKKKNKGEDDES